MGIYNPLGGGSSLEEQTLANGEYVELPFVDAGWGELIVGDNEERARFSWEADGTVTLMENTANVVNTDTNTKFCIFDNGTSVRIRNRLGSTKVVKYILNN